MIRVVIRTVVLFAVLVLCLPVRSDAADSYGKRVWQKFSRGLSNIVLSPLEVVRAVEDDLEDDNINRVALIAPIEGVGQAIGRALVGAYEVVTPFVPQEPIKKPLQVMPGLREYLADSGDEGP